MLQLSPVAETMTQYNLIISAQCDTYFSITTTNWPQNRTEKPTVTILYSIYLSFCLKVKWRLIDSDTGQRKHGNRYVMRTERVHAHQEDEVTSFVANEENY